MTDLELDALAEGVFKYLVEQTETPIDAISVLGMCLLKTFRAGTEGQVPITAFAEDFRKSLVESFNSASAHRARRRGNDPQEDDMAMQGSGISFERLAQETDYSEMMRHKDFKLIMDYTEITNPDIRQQAEARCALRRIWNAPALITGQK